MHTPLLTSKWKRTQSRRFLDELFNILGWRQKCLWLSGTFGSISFLWDGIIQLIMQGNRSCNRNSISYSDLGEKHWQIHEYVRDGWIKNTLSTSFHNKDRKYEKKKLSGFSPQANYTDRATAACLLSLESTFADRGCCVVSATKPHGRWFRFSRLEQNINTK
jgi:hypothetical protein